ncbi:potassium voltage-gated channel subfamily C member 3-like isoform X2 [Cygnus olor]|uniref:potassium voltage-gated channel subfamily C member 3-like isoform X2 n=1 Tax=Cygnus olor TaxID=8869 RepID=UPI001ADE1CF6|nr:potassium voltage-gated channel subfamily C member 3-like isoform X2 [Cygnus olor]
MDSSGFRLRFLSYTKTCSVRQESTSEDRKSFDRTSSRQRIGLLSGRNQVFLVPRKAASLVQGKRRGSKMSPLTRPDVGLAGSGRAGCGSIAKGIAARGRGVTVEALSSPPGASPGLPALPPSWWPPSRLLPGTGRLRGERDFVGVWGRSRRHKLSVAPRGRASSCPPPPAPLEPHLGLLPAGLLSAPPGCPPSIRPGKTTGNTGDLPPEPRSGHGQPLCLSRGSQHSSPEHPLRFASVAQLRFWTSDAFIN